MQGYSVDHLSAEPFSFRRLFVAWLVWCWSFEYAAVFVTWLLWCWTFQRGYIVGASASLLGTSREFFTMLLLDAAGTIVTATISGLVIALTLAVVVKGRAWGAWTMPRWSVLLALASGATFGLLLKLVSSGTRTS